jgi:phosphate transport system permease protein
VESSSSWSLTDRLGLAFAWFLGLLFCVICAAIVIYLLVEGIRYLSPDLLWTNPKVGTSQNLTGGFLGPMLGTVYVIAIAMALATPIGVGVAVWLSEYGRPRALARVVESTVLMFAGAPSIVLALFGLILFRASFLGFLTEKNGGVVYGKGFFPAGAMLALLALPLVVTSVREGLAAVPNHVREASYALGKTKISTIRRVLLPAVRPDIITGSMIGAGHAIGDTAIIVLLLGDTQVLQGVGNVPLLGTLRGTGSTLTSYVFDNAPTGDFNQPNKAFAAALVLLVLVLIINVFVDIFGRKARELKWT